MLLDLYLNYGPAIMIFLFSAFSVIEAYKWLEKGYPEMAYKACTLHILLVVSFNLLIIFR